jgi:hypothetical protein
MDFEDLQLGDYFYFRGQKNLMRRTSINRAYSFLDNDIIKVNSHRYVEKLKVIIGVERLLEDSDV